MRVFLDGTYFGETDSPEGLESYVQMGEQEDPPIARERWSLDLAEVRIYKEQEIRDAADTWYRENVRPFEGSIVVHQSATGSTMTREEKDIRAAMQANYLTLRDLVGRIRAATTPEEAQAVEWVDPEPTRVAAFSAALGEAESTIMAVRKRRRDRQGRLGNLEERVADLEADLEARMKIFEV